MLSWVTRIVTEELYKSKYLRHWCEIPLILEQRIFMTFTSGLLPGWNPLSCSIHFTRKKFVKILQGNCSSSVFFNRCIAWNQIKLVQVSHVDGIFKSESINSTKLLLLANAAFDTKYESCLTTCLMSGGCSGSHYAFTVVWQRVSIYF